MPHRRRHARKAPQRQRRMTSGDALAPTKEPAAKAGETPRAPSEPSLRSKLRHAPREAGRAGAAHPRASTTTLRRLTMLSPTRGLAEGAGKQGEPWTSLGSVSDGGGRQRIVQPQTMAHREIVYIHRQCALTCQHEASATASPTSANSAQVMSAPQNTMAAHMRPTSEVWPRCTSTHTD